MYLILIFGLLGLLVGGFRGLLVGLVLGYLARGWLQRHGQQNLGQVQAQFLDSTFAVMGAGDGGRRRVPGEFSARRGGIAYNAKKCQCRRH